MERLTIFRADGGGDEMLDKWKAMNEELRAIAIEHGAIFQIIARDGDDIVTVNLWRSAEAGDAMAEDPRVLEVLKRQGFDGPPPHRTIYDVERASFAEGVTAR
jgi:hypothetical protein